MHDVTTVPFYSHALHGLSTRQLPPPCCAAKMLGPTVLLPSQKQRGCRPCSLKAVLQGVQGNEHFRESIPVEHLTLLLLVWFDFFKMLQGIGPYHFQIIMRTSTGPV